MIAPHPSHAFPRYLNIRGCRVSSYKLFLCLGTYLGILVSAALAGRSGISPIRMGLGSLAIVIVGLPGARIYHLLVFAPHYLRARSIASLWNPSAGGSSLFGAVLLILPFSFVIARILQIPAAVFWDYLSAGILAGAPCARLGCVFNGCCGGRETARWYRICLLNTHGVRKSRVPVQFLEIGWWLATAAAFLWLWPRSFAPGTYALGVLAWYGLGRFLLEPLRENPDLLAARVRINQVAAALLALGAAAALLLRAM